MFLSIALVTCAYIVEPYINAERYLPTIERNAEPLVAAIRRFEAERGMPPLELDELVPAYIEALPGTGYGGQTSYFYFTGQGTWRLCVFSGLTLDHYDTFQYDSAAGHWRFIPR